MGNLWTTAWDQSRLDHGVTVSVSWHRRLAAIVAPLIEDVEFGGLIADKAFDSAWILEELDARGARGVERLGVAMTAAFLFVMPIAIRS